MTEAIERAARAACDAAGGNPDDQTGRGWEAWVPVVRAVMGAVREPSEAMIEAADASGAQFWSFEPGVNWETGWQAMIDALLTDTP